MAADFFNCTSLCLSSSVKAVGWISVLKKIDYEKQNFLQLSILKYCLICFLFPNRNAICTNKRKLFKNK